LIKFDFNKKGGYAFFCNNNKMSYIKALLIVFSLCSMAYAQDAKQMHETAKAFMKQGDYSNAILVLTRATELEPGNIAFTKDLALSYYFHNDYNKALEVIKPLTERDDADEQSFQIAGSIYKTLNLPKDAEKVYRKGLRQFPQSGPLYNDLGEIMWTQQDYDAIKEWKKGIEKDPAYSKNYYNAAKYYYLSTDKIWSILYGEIFLNMEPFSSKTPEIKDLLLESYKKLYLDITLAKDREYNRFETTFLQFMNKQSTIAGAGINPETLTMIRTRFILDWFNENKRPGFKLFDYQRQLLQEGLFDAYNQWIFGSAQNLSSFQNWINSHPDEYAAFTAFQKSRVFKVPAGEYYQK
jgi:tetratricopeptide (TPR) repeat protein